MELNIDKSGSELALELGVDKSVINKWRKKLGVRKAKESPLYSDIKFMTDNMHKSNRTLAEELGCAHSTIKTWRKNLKLSNPRNTEEIGVDTFKNKEWLRNACIDIGNLTHIAKLCNSDSDTIAYWIKKFDLKLGTQWRDVKRKHTVNHSFFKEIDSEDRAYWLGFMMADGCVARTDAGKAYNRFEVNLKPGDIGHLEKFKKALSASYPITHKSGYNAKLEFSYETVGLRINSRESVNHLIKNGITPNKTGKELLPTLSKEMTRHFIRGFMDGDGTITLKRTTGFCSASCKIIEEIRDFIQDEIGVSSNITQNKSDVPIYVISYSRAKSKILLDYLYKDSTIYLDRKFQRYQAMFCSVQQ